jgi:hypothetical protein
VLSDQDMEFVVRFKELLSIHKKKTSENKKIIREEKRLNQNLTNKDLVINEEIRKIETILEKSKKSKVVGKEIKNEIIETVNNDTKDINNKTEVEMEFKKSSKT